MARKSFATVVDELMAELAERRRVDAAYVALARAIVERGGAEADEPIVIAA